MNTTNTISLLIRKTLFFSGFLCILFSCALNDEGLFPQLTKDVVAKEPQYLIQASREISENLKLMRSSTSLNALNRADSLLEQRDFVEQGFYTRFLKQRLEELVLFKSEKIGVSELNASFYDFLFIDSILLEANQRPLSVSFPTDSTFDIFETEKPLILEYFFFEDGEDKGAIFEIDSVTITDLDNGAKFLSYRESLTVDDQREYVYTLGIEFNLLKRREFAIKQSYRFNSASLSFRLEKGKEKSVSGYSLSKGSKILINSSLEAVIDEDEGLLNGNLNVGIDEVEIVGTISNINDLLQELKFEEKGRSNFTTTSEEIQKAFESRTSLIARSKADPDDQLAEVALKSKVSGNGVVTGYSLLYPNSDVVFIPDHLKGVLDQVDSDLLIFGTILR